VVRKVLVCVLTAALNATLAAACGRGPEHPVAPPTAIPTQSATPTTAGPSPAPTANALRSPLTGLPVRRLAPVLAVKIDNTRRAHPQAGLTAADVVYVEQVEGGLTRLLAVFSSRLPRILGPVRSARVSDPELLRPYGPVAFAYSGANSAFVPILRKAPLRLLSNDDGGRGYRRVSGHRAPYNLFADPRALLARAPKAATARDIGFRFGPAPPGGRRVASARAIYPAARVSWAWSRSGRRWVVSMDDRPDLAAEGGRLGAPTMVVQLVKTERSRYGDRFGGVTPLLRTVGQGKAYVFRDGRMYAGTWSRQTVSAGTRFVQADGTPMTFAPGPVWVLLADQARPGAVNAS
jgi:hypothetical protein